MNVLVYNGPGASPSAVYNVIAVLRHFLEPYYAISTISPLALKNEPWATKAAALVFPGGADLPYCKECKPALPIIKRFVAKGGIYVGFCAGGYFATSRVEFSLGEPLEVVGDRALKLYPGIGRGPALRGFEYDSEEGSYAVKLKSIFPDAPSFTSYFNGGSVFVDAHLYKNVETLAAYDQQIDVPYTDNQESGSSVPAAAVVLCTVGKGKALLTGPHPEFNPLLLNSASEASYKPGVLRALIRDEPARLSFMKDALTKAGFTCNENCLSSNRLSLTPEFVCSLNTGLLQGFIDSLGPWNDIDKCFKLKCEADTFEIRKGFSEYKNLEEGLKDISPETAVKQLLVGTKEELIPPRSITPNFDISKYLLSLDKDTSLGSILVYGDLVTSTSVLLDRNKNLLAKFNGNSILHVGSMQLAGRGRGGNSWVNPRGVSASTVTFSVPLKSPRSGTPVPIVFVQYLAMVACCEAILSYGEGFEDMPIRIKWPNDLYALDPKHYSRKRLNLLGNVQKPSLPLGTEAEPAYTKISGMLVNTFFADGQYSILLGCGLNISNKAPTISLKTWVDILNSERKDKGQRLLPDIEEEILLAKYINNLDKLLAEFIDFGPQVILPRYYRLWLHTGQIVQLTDHCNTRGKIEGITSDFGMLFVKELKNGTDDQYTGSTFTLQPDGNSFDIFNGLISKKSS